MVDGRIIESFIWYLNYFLKSEKVAVRTEEELCLTAMKANAFFLYMLIYLFIYLYLYYILLFIFLYIYLFFFPEYKGLYSEGLYRKSPSNVAVKKLKNDICTLGEW